MPTLYLNDTVLFFIIVSNMQYTRKINRKLKLLHQVCEGLCDKISGVVDAIVHRHSYSDRRINIKQADIDLALICLHQSYHTSPLLQQLQSSSFIPDLTEIFQISKLNFQG